ncbi:MAG: aromatic amino acid transport family protein [Candidatus Pacebacteria bacterium]|nr:aromatic amino acid transport family protein [Candidatus Paceibacterota bacterium]
MNIKKLKKCIYATSILGGTIVGVGLFSLPYVAGQIGFGLFLVYFLVLGALVSVIHLLFGEVALKTPDFLRFSAYARIHLGKKGESVASTSVIISLFGSLIAYAIVGGKFLSEIFSPVFGGGDFFYILFYFFLGALIIYFGIKAISKLEFWGLFLFILALFLIALKSISHFEFSNLAIALNPRDLFLPYGPIIYAMWGAPLISESEEILGKDKKYLRKVIIASMIIPLIIYLFFTVLILGISGKTIAPEALINLGSVLGPNIYKIGLLFGFLTTITSFIALGLTLKKIFWYDYKINKNISWALTSFVPLFFFLLGFQNFIDIISFIGAVFLGILGILIILMYQKIKKNALKVKLLTMPLIFIFILGIIYQIIYFLNYS